MRNDNTSNKHQQWTDWLKLKKRMLSENNNLSRTHSSRHDIIIIISVWICLHITVVGKKARIKGEWEAGEGVQTRRMNDFTYNNGIISHISKQWHRVAKAWYERTLLCNDESIQKGWHRERQNQEQRVGGKERKIVKRNKHKITH